MSIGAANASNPVGAVRLVGAFQQAFAGAELSDSLRPLLFEEYEHALLQCLGDLYGKLNGLMAQGGLLVDPAGHAPPPKIPGDVETFRAPAETRWSSSPCASCCMRGAADPAAVSPLLPFGVREFQVEELVGIAATVQSEPVPGFAQSLAGHGHLDGRSARSCPRRRAVSASTPGNTGSRAARDAIDLVALLFTLVLQHPRLARPRPAIAGAAGDRLRPPRVPDELLFMRPEHPARRLLDAVALAAKATMARPGIARCSIAPTNLVTRRGRRIQRDLAVFSLAAERTQNLLQQQRNRAEVAERRAAEANAARAICSRRAWKPQRRCGPRSPGAR